MSDTGLVATVGCRACGARIPLSADMTLRKSLPETFMQVCPRCKKRDLFARGEICRGALEPEASREPPQNGDPALYWSGLTGKRSNGLG